VHNYSIIAELMRSSAADAFDGCFLSGLPLSFNLLNVIWRRKRLNENGGRTR